MIVKSEIEEVINIFRDLHIPFYFHAGFAINLLGFDSELDDCDIRVFHPDIKKLYKYIKEKYNYNINLRSVQAYEGGVYENECIQINNRTNFDICSRMIVSCDIGKFEFPFNTEVFKDILIFKYQGLSVPIASPESLLLYYLILRRGKIDNKNDELRIKDLLQSDTLNIIKFENMIEGLPLFPKINILYKKVKDKYIN